MIEARDAWSRHLGVPAAGDDLRDRLSAGSIAMAAHETALAGPERPAIEIDGAALTHGELDRAAGQFAGWLGARGVEAGDVALLSSPSSLAFGIGYLGAIRAGVTVVLANPAYTAAELDHLVADSGAVVAIAAGPGLERLGGLAGTHKDLDQVVDLAALSAPGGGLEAAPVLDPVAPDADRVALLAYTSGTTGLPKAVPLTDANVLSSIRAAMLAWRWDREDVLVHALPLFHQHGLGGLHTALLSGSRVIVHSRFDPERLCATLAAERASALFAVPAIYARLAEWAGIERAGLDRLRLLVSGSAALSPRLSERIAELCGQPPLERYGTTESGLDISNLYDGPRRAGFVGLPLPGLELVVASPTGEPLADGEDGEILLRGPQVFAGYRNNPDANAEAFHADGWFRTGDIGRIDAADGYLQITGRLRELIITGGMNVYPREVEFALEGHAGIGKAAVVGLPSERWGEEVAAAVVPATRAGVPATSEADLLEFARSRLAPYKCPKRVLFVDELPVNAMGKVVAADVRALF